MFLLCWRFGNPGGRFAYGCLAWVTLGFHIVGVSTPLVAIFAGDCLARFTIGFHFIGVSATLLATLQVAAWRELLLAFTLLLFGNPGDHLPIWVCGTYSHTSGCSGRGICDLEQFANSWQLAVANLSHLQACILHL